jgi:hypothetical protein
LITILIVALFGCTTRTSHQKGQKSPDKVSITTGMEYAKAKPLLASRGMKEHPAACWAVMPPENIILHTYFLARNEALIISEDTDTAMIVSMAIVGNTDKPVFHNTHKDISTYAIE